MKAVDFISLAGTLSVQPESSRLRTAISRAYYGSFHLATQFLTELGLSVGKDHDLHKPLLASRHVLAVEAGIYLSNLYDFRRRADYRLEDNHVEQQRLAMECVERARRIESLLQQCRTEPARSEILAGIQKNGPQSKPD